MQAATEIDLDQKIGDFRLSEFTRSAVAERKGIENIPGPKEVQNIWRLVRHVLQPVRDRFNEDRDPMEPERPLIITSGFRSPELNEEIGGSPNSQHLKGEAADFEMPGVSLLQIATFIRHSGIPFDQLILEHPPLGWIHVTYSDQHRRQVLTKMKGKPYVHGLPDRMDEPTAFA